MSTVREPKTATKTRPILISYDGSPDAARGIEAAAALLGPPRAVVVDVLPWLMSAEGLAAASSLVPGTEFEALNQLEARRFAARGAEIARSAGFRAEPRGEVASSSWEGIVGVADERDVALVLIVPPPRR